MFKRLWRWFQKQPPPHVTEFTQYASTESTQIPRTTKTYLHEGFRNKTVFRVVGQIARSAAGIRWKHYTDQTRQREYPRSALLDLWQKPNPHQGGASFREQMLAYYCLTGNNYMVGINWRGQPQQPFDELYNLRPDLTRIQPGTSGPEFYEFGASPPYKRYAPAFVMHNKLFSGSDDVYGLSPIEVAAMLVDIQKAGQRWNLALLSNMARPGGAWVTDQLLNHQDYLQLKREIRDKLSGPRSAGETFVLHGGVHWQSLALTPMELDFLNTDQKTDRDIAGIFFNFPVYLLGLNDSTFTNLHEARHFLYTDIVFPLLDMFVDSLNAWLTPRYGGFLDYDREDAEAVQEHIQRSKREASIRAGEEWLQGTSTFHETRQRQGKEALPCEDFIVLQGVPVPVSQIDTYIHYAYQKASTELQALLHPKKSAITSIQPHLETAVPLTMLPEATSPREQASGSAYRTFQRQTWNLYQHNTTPSTNP